MIYNALRWASAACLLSLNALAQSSQDPSITEFSPPPEYGKLTSLQFTIKSRLAILQDIGVAKPNDFVKSEASFTFTNRFEKGAPAPDLLYSIDQSQGSSKTPNAETIVWSYKMAYNGNKLQQLSHPREELAIASKPPQYDPIAYDLNAVFDPFRFISHGQQSFDGEIPTLQDLSSAENWRQVKASLMAGTFKVTNNGQDITFDQPCFNFSAKQNVKYEVTLDRNHGFYPIHWIMLGNDGQPIQEYLITELGQTANVGGLSLNYPKTAIMSYFVKGKLVSKATISVSNLTINPELDPEMFTFDPSAADTIWDNDKAVRIKVPR